ncbi:MAG: hypothetical protein EOS50_30240 [Mesorhizobium sp.]|nr:MAG: hypothetical protein EOS50_30240 [Mesorhizobium sp.]
MNGDLDIIKSGLIDRIESVCERLLPDGRSEGGLWVAWNPIEKDAKPGRLPALKVRIRGGDLGAWRCFRSGAKGDVLKLVAYVERTDIKGALAWGRDFLGIRAMSPAERQSLRKAEAVRKKERDDKAERARLYKLEVGDQLYFAKGGEKEIGGVYCPYGTSAFGGGSDAEIHAQRYFAARNVPIDALAGKYCFRFSGATEWWRGAKWDGAGGRKFKSAKGPLFPAVHSAMRQWNGVVTCCHVTFLDPVLPKKAPVDTAKLMRGEKKGAVIEVARGLSGKAFWMTEQPGPLVIAEGIETALSFAVNIPEARVWAAGDLGNIGEAPVNLACVEWVLFARDNNAGNSQAQKQFETALAGLERHGKTVVVEASHVGDDFNDLAQGEE